MRLSVQVVTGLQITRPYLALCEMAFHFDVDISRVCLAPALRILAKSVHGFGPERERFVDFGADMLEESGHNGETAHDDTD